MQNTIVIFAALFLLFGCTAGTHPTTAPATQSAGGFIDAGNWKAWINRMPGSTPTLHVEGSVTLAATNFAPELKFDSRSPSNPPELTLRLFINKTGDMGGMRISEKVARYDDRQNVSPAVIRVLRPDGRVDIISQIETAH